jgi:hypothetical protein
MGSALAGSLRVIEATLDDERALLVVVGELEFGVVRKGMEARLSLPSGGFVPLLAESAGIVQDSAGFPRQAVHFKVAAPETREALRGMTLAGQELQMMRARATTSSLGLLNGIFAALGLLILAASFVLPTTFDGQHLSSKDVAWQAASVLLFVGSFVLIRKSMNWSLVVLMLACAFFFVSCTANFQLRM